MELNWLIIGDESGTDLAISVRLGQQFKPRDKSFLAVYLYNTDYQWEQNVDGFSHASSKYVYSCINIIRKAFYYDCINISLQNYLS
jgi:hypothetical protein